MSISGGIASPDIDVEFYKEGWTIVCIRECTACYLLFVDMPLQLQERSVAGSGWNLEVVRDVIGSKFDAEKLALELDHPEFTLPSAQAFLVLMALWWGATSGKQFPLQTLIQRSWSNVMGQLEFLKFATAAPKEVFSFETAERKLPFTELLQVSSTLTKACILCPSPCAKPI